MSSSKLAEVSSKLIREYLKANIAAALIEVRTDRDDPIVTTDVPRNYFFYKTAQAYQCPSVFIVAPTVDYQKELGANHVNAIISFNISVVVEDRAEEYLWTKANRYAAALHKLLDQNALQDGDVKVTTVVTRENYSDNFVPNGMTNFRREVLLQVDAYHYEKF